MKIITQPNQEKQPSIIRTETAFSKFPIHNLGKKGQDTTISITRKNSDGEINLLWRVSPNRDYGEPRQLAYKLDTLAINRRLDEVGRPLPEVIRLGSLNQLCKELGIDTGGRTKGRIKKALLQNAFAGITAKFSYKGNDGVEQEFRGAFTRYAVVFTGEEFPDGRKADCVYLILNKLYRDVLNNSPVRPLDYDYLKQLPPAAQRFYEIVSFKIFAAIRNKHPHATLRYSDYCTYSARKRHYQWEQVKKQMYVVHRPHAVAGYIKKVRYEPTTDDEGHADWIMSYTIGEKAQEEYTAFNQKREGTTTRPALETPEIAPLVEALRDQAQDTPDLSELTAILCEKGIQQPAAIKLCRTHPESHIRSKLEMFDFLDVINDLSIPNPAGWLRSAIEQDYELTEKQRKRQEARARERTKEDRKERWLAHRATLIKQDLQNWDALTTELTQPLLDIWLFKCTRFEHREPTFAEIEAKGQELLDGLPTTANERYRHLEHKRHSYEPPDNFV